MTTQGRFIKVLNMLTTHLTSTEQGGENVIVPQSFALGSEVEFPQAEIITLPMMVAEMFMGDVTQSICQQQCLPPDPFRARSQPYYGNIYGQ